MTFVAFNIGVPDVWRTGSVPGLLPGKQKYDKTYCRNKQTQAISDLLLLSQLYPSANQHVGLLLVVVKVVGNSGPFSAICKPVRTPCG